MWVSAGKGQVPLALIRSIIIKFFKAYNPFYRLALWKIRGKRIKCRPGGEVGETLRAGR